MEFIASPDVPPPSGHYSQAVRTGGLVFVSGTLPGNTLGQPFEPQVREVFARCASVLAAAGCALTDVVQCTAYIVGKQHWAEFNRVYAELFGEHRPARAVVPVGELNYGALVEVQLVAQCGTAKA